MKHRRIDIASIRKEQIVEAAISIIAEQGIQNLSLSEIEQKAGMSRGQLTYYFRTKEDILLAVFDRLLVLMYQRVGTPDGAPCTEIGGWERVQHLLEKLIQQSPLSPEFHSLQYTFLSQIAHRNDFRQRLASLYGEWRSRMAEDLAGELKTRAGARRTSPRALASFIQAILHGLAMQLAADPDAFDREEMLQLCLDVLETFVRGKSPRLPQRKTRARKKAAPNGSHVRRAVPARGRSQGAKS